jgi:hypothetical protein
MMFLLSISCAAMQQADLGIDALDDLAVKVQDQAQYPCAAGCCGPKLIVETAERSLHHAGVSFASLEPETPGTFICSAIAPRAKALKGFVTESSPGI